MGKKMDESIDTLIDHIYNRRNESVWTLTVGKKGYGKTNWNLDQLERIYKRGHGDAFGSNMPLEAEFPIDRIDNFEDLENRCRLLNPDPKKHGLKRYFYFGSEMGKFLPKDQAYRNVKFLEKLQLVRKYGLCWLGDGIDRIDARVFNATHFNGYFIKTSLTTAKYIDWTHNQIAWVLNIPKTKIEFDTYYSANFTMEPEGPNGVMPLDPNAQIVKQYVDNDCSWKKAGIPTYKGKRAIIAVAKAYLKIAGHVSQESTENPAILESSTEIREEFT